MCSGVHSAVLPAKEGRSCLGTVSLNGQEKSCTELCSFLAFCRFERFFQTFPRGLVGDYTKDFCYLNCVGL